jgi:hypothetical protein
LIANRRERFANEFFVRERAICFRGIEEGHAALEGGTNDLDAFLSVLPALTSHAMRRT